MKKITLILLSVLTFSASSYAQDIMAYWNQNNNSLPGGGFGFLADPDSFPQDADLGTGLLSFGGGILDETVTNENDDLVYTWLQSFAGSDINLEGADESGGSIAVQGGTDGANNGSYLQFEFSMEDHSNLNISYATRGTATGFTTQTWSWSTDGENFTDFSTVNDTNVTEFFLAEVNAPASLNGAATVTLRVSFEGAATSNGNNRLDNIKFVADEGIIASVGENTLSGFALYPNPANSLVSIETTNNDALSVAVFDVLGKQVMSVEGNTFDVSALKTGIYMVQVSNGTSTAVKKLMVK